MMLSSELTSIPVWYAPPALPDCPNTLHVTLVRSAPDCSSIDDLPGSTAKLRPLTATSETATRNVEYRSCGRPFIVPRIATVAPAGQPPKSGWVVPSMTTASVISGWLLGEPKTWDDVRRRACNVELDAILACQRTRLLERSLQRARTVTRRAYTVSGTRIICPHGRVDREGRVCCPRRAGRAGERQRP